jgi:hypothetical protein
MTLALLIAACALLFVVVLALIFRASHQVVHDDANLDANGRNCMPFDDPEYFKDAQK